MNESARPESTHTESRNQQWFERLTREQRIALWTMWLATVELGWRQPAWATFALRLGYLFEHEEMDQKTWAKKASVKENTLSGYFTGKRGWNEAREESDSGRETAKNVYSLLSKAKVPAELPWVLNGPESVLSTASFGARCGWALEAKYGEMWQDKAKSDGLFERDLLYTADGSETDKQQYAQRISHALGSAISSQWLLTGRTSPPQAVRDCATKLSASGDQPGWQALASRKVRAEMSLDQLIALVELVEMHQRELPATIRKQIRSSLLAPIQEHTLLGPMLLMHSLAAPATEEQMQDARIGVLRFLVSQRPWSDIAAWSGVSTASAMVTPADRARRSRSKASDRG